jgi:hypothetical protein
MSAPSCPLGLGEVEDPREGSAASATPERPKPNKIPIASACLIFMLISFLKI